MQQHRKVWIQDLIEVRNGIWNPCIMRIGDEIIKPNFKKSYMCVCVYDVGESIGI